mmetsp:Transcript_5751/g.17134  ORF Transcript_5751/g.17134 Transcript_5751/m.17134 type:complete len:81 (-) Transcript_5751:350-592(-)
MRRGPLLRMTKSARRASGSGTEKSKEATKAPAPLICCGNNCGMDCVLLREPEKNLDPALQAFLSLEKKMNKDDREEDQQS